MAGDLVKIDGDRGEFRVTRQMLTNLPRDTYWHIDEWFERVTATNPHLKIEAWHEDPSQDTVIRWEPRDTP